MTGYADHARQLCELNERLQATLVHRCAVIDREVQQLLALRFSLSAAPITTRKRRRDAEGRLSTHLGSGAAPFLSHQRGADFFAALDDTVRRTFGGGLEPLLCDSPRWRTVADAVRSAGQPALPPRALMITYAERHRSEEPFSTAESRAVCQYVQRHGADWVGLCRALVKRFGHARSVFQVAQHYRQAMRRAFVQGSLSPEQLRLLLRDSAAPPHGEHDFAALSIHARRFVAHKTLQVSPAYLKRELEPLAFAARLPVRQQLYWKLANLLCRFRLRPPYRLDALHHKMPFCYQQLSLADLARCLQCGCDELRERIVSSLLTLSRSPATLSYTDLSKELFGSADGAQAVFRIALKLHDTDATAARRPL